MANLKTTQETTRTPIDGTELVRLALAGNNYKATLSSIFSALGGAAGGDPLFLTQGMSIIADNPTVSGDANDRWAAKIKVTTDVAQSAPTFSNFQGLGISMYATNGQATNGPRTQAKVTFLPYSVYAVYNASGQKNLTYEHLESFGMSDTSLGQQFVQYSGGPVNGDEGQGFRLVSTLQQQPYLNVTTITAKPTQSVVNTTTTQTIVPSKDPQTVTVASTTGAVNGTWVVIEQEVAKGDPNLEAVQIISFTATSITGIFRYHHDPGVTVTPALVISCGSTYQMGQDRILVNLSGPSYSTGSVTAINGGGMDFSGTALTNNIVGGTVLNIGAISLTADDCTAGIWSSNTLKSWYQITAVTSATHLSIHSYSCAGDVSYIGRGPGPSGSGAGGTGAYIIRPCAKVLRIGGSNGNTSGELICETSNAALWNVGHTVEQAICPYADITAFQYRINHWTPGGAGVRAFMTVENWGTRMYQVGLHLGIGNGGIGQPTADTVAFNKALTLTNANVGITTRFCKQSAIQLFTAAAGGGDIDAGGWINWDQVGVNQKGIGPNTPNAGISINGTDTTSSGQLDFVAGNSYAPSNPDAYRAELRWKGYFHLPVVVESGARPGYIVIDNVTHATDFERAFFRWASNVFEIGTEKGGSGSGRDLVLKTDNAEHIRLRTGANIKFTAAAHFTSNGSVATALSSVGPPGSHTTVQKWLTIVDGSDNTLYIPCF
jgi:hypothetical protein